MVQQKNNVYLFQDYLHKCKQQNNFNILFIILTHGKFNVNNCFLDIVLPLYHITIILMMAMEY